MQVDGRRTYESFFSIDFGSNASQINPVDATIAEDPEQFINLINEWSQNIIKGTFTSCGIAITDAERIQFSVTIPQMVANSIMLVTNNFVAENHIAMGDIDAHPTVIHLRSLSDLLVRAYLE
jgi:hypothetical protein